VFLASADLIILTLAFLSAHYFAPEVQRLLLPGGALHGLLPSVLPVPQIPTAAPDFPTLSELVWLLAATAPVTLIAMELLGGYQRLVGQSVFRLVLNVIVSQLVAIGFGALILVALKLSSSSRVITFTYALVSIVGLVVCRTSLWGYQRRRQRRGAYAKNVLLIGEPRSVELMIKHFERYISHNEFRLVGWLSAPVPAPVTHFAERRRDDALREIPLQRLGSVDDLGQLLVHQPVHELIVIHSSDRKWLWRVMELCDYFRVRLRVIPGALLLGNLRDLSLTFHSDPMRLPEIVLSPARLDADSLVVKRLIDVIVSAVLLIVLAPLFLLIALAIKITTPRLRVFYPWHVIGLNGRPFTGYKFTTMVADADALKDDLIARNEMQGPVFKVKDDPRITPLGRLLRKFSLNELPQLWSVLKGDMSLVGPRPAFRHELERYALWHKRKLCVKPGITCLWQVSGRNRISDFDEWVRLDLEYIDRWNLWLDMRILARTVWTVVAGSGW
jgi:exopolysaccharide biosynthesis polyprenyl glycosylphosphotransferase